MSFFYLVLTLQALYTLTNSLPGIHYYDVGTGDAQPCSPKLQTGQEVFLSMWVKLPLEDGALLRTRPSNPQPASLHNDYLQVAVNQIDIGGITPQYIIDERYIWIGYSVRRVDASNCVLTRGLMEMASTSPTLPINKSAHDVFPNLTSSHLNANITGDYIIPEGHKVVGAKIHSDRRISLQGIVFDAYVTDTDLTQSDIFEILKFGYMDVQIGRYSLMTYDWTVVKQSLDGKDLTPWDFAKSRIDNPETRGLRLFSDQQLVWQMFLSNNIGLAPSIFIYNYQDFFAQENNGIRIQFSIMEVTIAPTIVNIAVANFTLQHGNGKVNYNITIAAAPYMVEADIVVNQTIGQFNFGEADVTSAMQVIPIIYIMYHDFPPYSGGTVSGTITAYLVVYTEPTVQYDGNYTQHMALVSLDFTVNCLVHPFDGQYKALELSINHFPPGNDYKTTAQTIYVFNGGTNIQSRFSYSFPSSSIGCIFYPKPSDAVRSNEETNVHSLTFAPYPYGVGLTSCPSGNCKFTTSWRSVEECIAGYYPDLTNTYKKGLNDLCKTKAQCMVPGYIYVNPDEGGPNQNGGVCLSCPENCKTCNSSYNCTECITLYSELTNNLCVCKVANCTTCIGTVCDYCKRATHALHVINNTNRWCRPILEGRPRCDYLYGQDNSFVANALDRYQYYVCRPCAQNNCINCYADYNTCTTDCGVDYPIDLSKALDSDYSDTAACRAGNNVIKGYYWDSVLSKYILCKANCSDCSVDPSSCVQCAIGFLYMEWNGTCEQTTTCPLGSYLDGYWCKLCSVVFPGCRKCVDNIFCLICPTGKVFDRSLPNCIDEIVCKQNGKTKDIVFHNYIQTEECVACPLNCLECSNITSCDTCDSGHSHFHKDLNQCVDPASFCTNTTRSFIISGTTTCQYCKTFCAGCTTETDCYQCQAGMYLRSSDYACLSTIPPSSTFDPNGTIVDCPQNCETCSWVVNVGASCDTCKPGYFLNLTRSCVDCSRVGYMIDSNQICMQCEVENCKNCNGDSTKCQTCMETYFQIGDSECRVCSPPNNIVGSACIVCQPLNCQKCSLEGEKCIVCNPGYVVNDLGQCIIGSVKVTQSLYFKKNSTVKIVFDKEVLVKFQHTISATIIDLDSHENFPSSIAEVVSSLDQLYLKLITEKSIEKAAVRINFNDLTSVTAVSDSSKLDPKYSQVTVDGASFNYPRPSKAEQITTASGSIFLTIVATGSTIMSINYAILLIKIYQMMDFMLLFNVNYPDNFQRFIVAFKAADPLSNLPNVFSSLIDENCLEMPMQVEEEAEGCEFLSNAYTSVMLIGGYAVATLVLKLIQMCLKKKIDQVKKLFPEEEKTPEDPPEHDRSEVISILGNNKSPNISPKEVKQKPSICKRIVLKLDSQASNMWHVQSIYFLALSFDLDFLLASAINSKYYVGDLDYSLPSYFNHFVSQAIIYLYPFLICYFWVKTYKSLRTRSQELEYLIEGRKTRTTYQVYREVISLVRNYLISVIVIGQFFQPLQQMGLIVSMLLSTFLMEYSQRIFLNRIETWQNILLWAFYTLSSGALFITWAIGDKLADESRERFLGIPLIMFFSGIVLSNLIPPIFQSISECRGKKYMDEDPGPEISTRVKRKLGGIEKNINVKSSNSFTTKYDGHQSIRSIIQQDPSIQMSVKALTRKPSLAKKSLKPKGSKKTVTSKQSSSGNIVNSPKEINLSVISSQSPTKPTDSIDLKSASRVEIKKLVAPSNLTSDPAPQIQATSPPKREVLRRQVYLKSLYNRPPNHQ